MFRTPSLAFFAIAGLGLVACAGFKIGKDGFGFELAGTRIQSEIDKHAGFPFRKEVAQSTEVRVQNAALRLFPEDNAIGLTIPVQVKIPFSKLEGAATVTTVPEYVPAEGTIYVTHLTVRDLVIPGLAKPIERLVADAATQIIEHSIERYKVYELDRNKYGESMARLVLRDVKVHPDGVFFRLGF